MKLTKALKSTIAVVVAVLVIQACSKPSGEFGHFVDIAPAGWAYGDTVAIATSTIDSLSAKQLTVAVCHNDQFLYQNLWLEVATTDSLGTVTADTLNIAMADTYGRWLGQGMGDSYQCSVDLPQPVNIAAGSDVKIRHIMRVDTIQGVEKVGIIVKDI